MAWRRSTDAKCRRGALAEARAAGRVEEQRVRVGDRGVELSHDV